MALALAQQSEKHPDPWVELRIITPALAQEWLAKNIHNRSMKPRVRAKYAGAMTRGEWELNGETIKFDWDDVLADGQNRLGAVIDSGVSIRSFVVFGLRPEAQDSMDQHSPRTLADVLALHGEKSATDLASALTVFWRIQLGLESQTDRPSGPQALALLDEHPQLRESVHMGNRVQARIGTPRGMVAALHYTFASLDAEDAEFFFARLIDGENLESTSGIYVFREWCLRELRGIGIGGRRPAWSRVQAYMVKAWNAYRRGDEVRQLKWSVGGARPEPFPKAV